MNLQLTTIAKQFKIIVNSLLISNNEYKIHRHK